MALLALYWGVMIICYIIASKLRHKAEKFNFLEELTNIVIYALVFVMGLRMGSNEQVTSSLGTIGLQAVGITIFTVGGSMIAVFGVRKLMGLNKKGLTKAQAIVAEKTDCEETNTKQGSGLIFTLIILAFVIGGMLAGYFLVPAMFKNPEVFQKLSSDWLVVGIATLLGLVGFNLGLSGNIVQSFKGVGIKIIFVPLAAVGGSLAMGAVYGLITSLSVNEAVAISAGFGWYTLAPGMLTEAGFAVAGAVSFMHNVIRETLGIVGIPIIAKKIGYLEAISVPGVAAMDVCIPIVKRSCREETIVYSFCTGALMCIAVPIVVTFAIG